MKMYRKFRLVKTSTIMAALLALMFAAPGLQAQTEDAVNQLKAMVEDMKKTIEAQNARILELEKNKAAQPVPAPAPAPTPGKTAPERLEESSPSIQTVEKIAVGEEVAHRSP